VESNLIYPQWPQTTCFLLSHQPVLPSSWHLPQLLITSCTVWHPSLTHTWELEPQ
jgi:hypothetical protein